MVINFDNSLAADQKPPFKFDSKHSLGDISPSQTFPKYEFSDFSTVTLRGGEEVTVPSPNEIRACVNNQEPSQRATELDDLLNYIRQISESIDFNTDPGKEDAGLLRIAVITIIRLANQLHFQLTEQTASELLQTIPTEILPQRSSSEISPAIMKLFTGETQAREQYPQKVWRRYD